MSRPFLKLALGGSFFALALSGCVHTPRGTSVEIALAKRPQVVRVPTPAPSPSAPGSRAGTGGAPISVETGKEEKIADAYSRGEFCMTTGNDTEAINAFREVVKLDPKFSKAWSNLAALYERGGQEKLALEAFRKSKTQ